jgi:aminoglycoside 6'-N-acetyltransferase
MKLVGDRVVVRSVADTDLPALEAVMSCPGVRAWWWDFDVGKFALELHDPDTHPFVIEHAGAVIGYMQCSEEESLQYHFASIDLSLHDDYQGRGFGRDAVRTLARYLFDERGHHRITIDPAADNAAAIRAYTKVGFRPVGVMRQYEQDGEGSWRDGLLMDLLTEELVRAS